MLVLLWGRECHTQGPTIKVCEVQTFNTFMPPFLPLNTKAIPLAYTWLVLSPQAKQTASLLDRGHHRHHRRRRYMSCENHMELTFWLRLAKSHRRPCKSGSCSRSQPHGSLMLSVSSLRWFPVAHQMCHLLCASFSHCNL